MSTLSTLALLSLEPRDHATDSPYDRAARALLRYDRVLGRSSERVERCIEQLRRHHAQRVHLRALPEAILRLQGPAGGITGGRLRIANGRAHTAELSFRIQPLNVDGRRERALAKLGARPATLTLAPGVTASVSLWIDLGPTGLLAGELAHGDVELLVDDEVTLRVGLEIALY